MSYTNSPLVSYTKLSPNHSGKRTHAIDRITPHCVVGQCSVETLGRIFAPTTREASCNYGIGYDGRVGMYVEECNRSWCSSSNANDQRAVTIECASDNTAPYAFRDVVYKKLIELCVDICKRNGKSKLIWLGDKAKTLNYSPASNEMVLTVHRWFDNKSCPGGWMYARMGDLAKKVTAALGGASEPTPQPNKPATLDVQVGDIVDFKGGKHYANASAASGDTVKASLAKVTAVYPTGKHPVHLRAVNESGEFVSGVYGWVDVGRYAKRTTGGAVTSADDLNVGDIVNFKGGTHYTSANAASGSAVKASKAKVTAKYNGKHPIHLRAVNDSGAYINGVYGWVDLSSITVAGGAAKKSIDEIAREVIAGKWGNGAERRCKLESAGYDYAAVQKRVNELLS